MALIGQMAMMGTYAPSGVTSVTLISITITSAATIAWPAGLQAGDVAVLADAGSGIGAPASVTPTGFTNVVDCPGVVHRLMVDYKILDGTEAGNIMGISSGIGAGKCLYIYRGNVPITAVVPSTWNSEATTGDPAPQTVLASPGAPPLVVFGANIGTNGNTTFSTASPAFDATENFGSANFAIAGYKIYNSSPANHTIDMTDNNANALVSGYLQLS
ncbi:hypothetical protein [Mesorhizobium sp. M1348]|uniref:hypothetical protein n=1 Tax=Mesorhizobium sp. M1348 TaxID=2957089 RepID=UPI00333B4D93